MRLAVDGIVEALRLLARWDPQVWQIVWLTLKVSLQATALAVVLGVPLGGFLALTHFRGKRIVAALVNAGMALPPVVVGLLVSMLLWRYGPLGSLGILYTPAAMVVAQTMLAMPPIAAFTMSGVGNLHRKFHLQLLALGATPLQVLLLLLKECRIVVLAGVMAGFGAAISEVGASMMVGGNIMGHTRVLTTATVMEVSKGNFDTAIALSLILSLVVYGAAGIVTYLQQQNRAATHNEPKWEGHAHAQ